MLSLVLLAPSLFNGLVWDDLGHRLSVQGRGAALGMDDPLDLFRFVSGDLEANRRLIEDSFLPWYSLPDLRIAFLRPVSAVTHYIDYRFWPEQPVLMHVESELWYGALVLAALAFYRRIEKTPWVAGLAGVLYAWDEAHAMAVGWLANRNAVIAATLGVVTLLLYDRAVRREPARYPWLATGTFTLALLAGESAVATLAYLGAHALCLDDRSPRIRLAGLAPFLAVVVTWRVAYHALGYGAYGSALYIDPLTHPLMFTSAVLDRGPILLLAQLVFTPSELWAVPDPSLQIGLRVGAAIAVLWVAVVAAPLVRKDRLARFYAVGMLAAVVPICAAFPADRLLFFTGLGAMGLIARTLAALWDRAPWLPRAAAWRAPAIALAATWVALHLVVAPLLTPLRSLSIRGFDSIIDRGVASIPNDAGLADETLIIVNAPDFLIGDFMPIWLLAENRVVPKHTHTLALSLDPITVKRLDERTIEVRPARGYFAKPTDGMFRSELHPAPAGYQVELESMTARFTELNAEGRPAAATFTFRRRLEDAPIRWVAWSGDEFQPFDVPKMGGETRLGGIDALGLFTGG